MIRLLLLLLALPAQAEEIVARLSQNEVAITATFDGSEIFVFGAVKRLVPPPIQKGPLEVVITVQGPSEPIMVRRKSRVAGIWVNTDQVMVDVAPSFYAIASTGVLEEIMSNTERLRHRIGFDQAIRLVGAPADIDDPRLFTRAVTRINRDQGMYWQSDGVVSLADETLFFTSMALPANLVEGTYKTRMFLLRSGEVVNVAEDTIFVRKTGIERMLYNLAQEQPLIYALLTIVTALGAGWLASEIFRWIRG